MCMWQFPISMGMDMGMGDRLSFEKDSTVDHAMDFFCCLADEIDVVGDKYIGEIDTFQDVYNLLRSLGIKACCWFIQEQDLWLHVDGVLATWQQSQVDGSQPLVGNFLSFEEIAEILDS